MNKWITIEKEYKNEGIALTVSCKRAKISLYTLVSWQEKLHKKIDTLCKEIEREVLGESFNYDEIRLSHYSNKDLDNLIVTLVASYPPMKLLTKVAFNSSTKQYNAQSKLLSDMMELIWDAKLKKIN